MHTEFTLKKILKTIVACYKQVYGDSLHTVYLYGSYARGDYDNESDIDIVAIVDGNRLELQKKLKEVWDVADELDLEYGVIVSPTVIPLDEFNRYKEDLPYYANIAKEGIEMSA
ncbi:MAG: nucleotidyltransferase domain-containing protein [Megasphaera sp.]|jgi:predicted nucleotidyltransferase|nr:nucleotidyltransferase domain-containing protein [Megasphaera sp.]MCH4188488.1 nucleotidyltransferase domain-containing protein [Megasphaera sp.]MCH4218430.1 nucleotidyltransferase domain-containing protein [Megasphaera sp.]